MTMLRMKNGALTREVRITTTCTATVYETWTLVVPADMEVNEETALELLEGNYVVAVENELSDESDRELGDIYDDDMEA